MAMVASSQPRPIFTITGKNSPAEFRSILGVLKLTLFFTRAFTASLQSDAQLEPIPCCVQQRAIDAELLSRVQARLSRLGINEGR